MQTRDRSRPATQRRRQGVSVGRGWWDDGPVSRTRILGGLLVVGAGVAACVPVHNMLASRDIECRETPDELCLRIAELGLQQLNVEQLEADQGPIPTIFVYPEPCPMPNAVRCWIVEATNERGGSGVLVRQRADGSIGVD